MKSRVARNKMLQVAINSPSFDPFLKVDKTIIAPLMITAGVKAKANAAVRIAAREA